MKTITITFLLFLIVGCGTQFGEISPAMVANNKKQASRATDTYICQIVWNKTDPWYLTSKSILIPIYEIWQDEMKTRNLNCLERFPNGGYEGPTYLEILLQEE